MRHLIESNGVFTALLFNIIFSQYSSPNPFIHKQINSNKRFDFFYIFASLNLIKLNNLKNYYS